MKNVDTTIRWVLPYVLAGVVMVLVGMSGNLYLATVGAIVAVNAIAASGLSLFVSYAGQFSLGHGAIMGIGAYGAAIVAKQLQVPPVASILFGIVAAALVGLLIGLPAIRLQGYYLAIATYGMGVIVFVVFQEGGTLTGGAQGLSGIPPLVVFGLNFSRDAIAFFILASVLALLAVLVIQLIVRSNYGRGLRLLSQSEPAAQAMGVAVSGVKLQIFVLSAALAGLAGGLYAYSIRYLDAGAFSPTVSIALLIMIALGGVRSAWGPLIGAALFVGLREVLKEVLPLISPQAGTRVETLFFGLILILVLIFPPDSLWSRLKGTIGRRAEAEGPTAVRPEEKEPAHG